MAMEIGMASKESKTRYKQKTEIFLITRPRTWILLFVCKKGEKKDRNVNFHVKISLKLLVNDLLGSVFSLITWMAAQ